MTFALSARCARTGMMGIAISSSSPCVAARCSHARAGVGAISTQNITDPRLGPAGLEHLAEGSSAERTIALLCEQAGVTAPYRQLTAIDARGRAAAFSGEGCLGRYAQHVSSNAAAAGNLLASREAPEAMVHAFTAAPNAHLAQRLLGALRAALAVGGEEGPLRSAGLLVVHDQAWPLIDLRVDWSDSPIADLETLWTLWQPQMHDYVIRALAPGSSPAYGVPGDP